MCFEVGVLACLVVCARLFVAAAVVVFVCVSSNIARIRLAAASRPRAALSCTCWVTALFYVLSPAP